MNNRNPQSTIYLGLPSAKVHDSFIDADMSSTTTCNQS